MTHVSAPSRRLGRRRTSSPHVGPDPVDIHVGARVRLRRILLGLSKESLAEAIGLSYQQIQKYERGTNRISASMLHHIARALGVPVSFFFDGMEEDGTRLPPAGDHDPLFRRESLELMRRYHSLPEEMRRQVYELVKAMAGAWGEPEPAGRGSQAFWCQTDGCRHARA